jgi:hypothetical protein
MLEAEVRGFHAWSAGVESVNVGHCAEEVEKEYAFAAVEIINKYTGLARTWDRNLWIIHTMYQTNTRNWQKRSYIAQ